MTTLATKGLAEESSRLASMTGLRTVVPVLAHLDRFRILPWVAAVTMLAVSSILGYNVVFTTPADIAAMQTLATGNPAIALLFGIPNDLTTAEGFTAWRTIALGGLFAAVMATLTVIRNSRAFEDSGQAELLGAGVLGRHALLGSAVTLAVGASTAIGVISWVAMSLAGANVGDAAALSATYTVTGMMFAGVAAVAAQIGSTARASTTMAMSFLGASYLLRGLSDSESHLAWLSWLTPLGWTIKVAPAAGNHLWPLVLCVSFVVACLALSVGLQRNRDYGTGLIAPRRGPDRGDWTTRSVAGMAVRLQWAPVVSWSVGLAVMSSVMGYVASSVGELLPDGFPGTEAGAGLVTDLSFALYLTLLQVMGLLVTVLGLQLITRLHTEEAERRVEPLLATAVRRRSLFSVYAVAALVAPTAVLLGVGTVMGLAGSAADSPVAIAEVVRQAWAYAPAMWIVVAVGIGTIGARPSVRSLSWLVYGAVFTATVLAPLFAPPEWVLGLSPYWHIPNVRAESAFTMSWWVLVALSVALVATGFVGYRNRDIS